MVTTTDHEARSKSSRPVSRPNAQPESLVRWQTILKTAIRNPRTLCQRLQLPDSWISAAEQAAALFPLFAPLPYVDRIERGNPADPLLRQILPLQEEFESPAGFVTDPVGDQEAQLASGLLHKYQGRALL
ncbi:MAG: EF-P beta-lysylation protein EpmB, partial [Pirellulaceae bacterium]|nr:EF-P beta-lysylation protein EpmB [Pirellulaceae bacterium]